jgi:hypothetical protein
MYIFSYVYKIEYWENVHHSYNKSGNYYIPALNKKKTLIVEMVGMDVKSMEMENQKPLDICEWTCQYNGC